MEEVFDDVDDTLADIITEFVVYLHEALSNLESDDAHVRKEGFEMVEEASALVTELTKRLY